MIEKYFWIVFIVAHTLNGLAAYRKMKPAIADDASLKETTMRYLKRWWLIGNIPWFVLGISVLSGLATDMFDALSYDEGHRTGIAFIASAIAVWLSLMLWVFVYDGAHFYLKHPGLLRTVGIAEKYATSIQRIKKWFVIAYILPAVAVIGFLVYEYFGT